MAGRPPKPTALKVIEGNRGKRAANKQEPDPNYLVNMDPPEWLRSGAAAVWREVAPKLSAAKLLTEVDVQTLAMGCVAIDQFRRASAKANDNLVKTKLVEDGEGKLVETGEHINPWAMVQSMAFKQAMTILQQFGMSPAARTRIAVNPQGDLFGSEKENGAARFFG
jgi:P27 family predicted phage terminase small subunit